MRRFKRLLLPLLILLALTGTAVSLLAQWQLPTGSVIGFNGDTSAATSSTIPTALSESGNVVTITATNALVAGQSFTLSGATPSGYNGNYIVLTASASSITALNATSSLGAGTVFGILQSPALGPGGLVSTVTGLQIKVAPGAVYCSGNISALGLTYFTLNASSTYYIYYRCPTDQLIASTTGPVPNTDVLLDTTVTGVSSITSNTDNRLGANNNFPAGADFVWNVPLHDCGWNLTTGALATASTIGENVGIVFAATNNPVNQIKTTAAANVANLDCDITPPWIRSGGARGFTISVVEIKYGYQTTAPTSIGAPTLATVLGATSGNATAAGTVAAVGGTLVQNVGTNHTTPGAVTTTGTCYTEDTVPTTPILITNPLMRLTYEQIFNQTAASASVFQLCGLVVYGSYVP